MGKITTMLLMMFLVMGASSCGTTGKVICAQIKDLEMKPLPAGDFSFKFNRCRARCLDPNTWAALPLNKCKADFPDATEGEFTRNYPIDKCEGLSGFFIEDVVVEIRPKLKALNTIKKDYCN